MNFSDTFKQSNQLCKFSPNGNYLANTSQFRLIIRDVKTLQIRAFFTCLDSINYIEWSSDSSFVLCALYKRGVVQVWSLERTEWTCKIDHGSMGLVAARWSPDSRHILSTSEFKLRITIWSLINKSVSYIKYPKHSTKGLAFSKNGQYMAVAERRNCKDFVMIFICDGWEVLSHFAVDTQDLAELSFSPNNCMIAIWDSKLEYKVVIYSLDGRFLSSYSAYDAALGIKTVAWSPSNQFLVVGSYDQQARILNNITWKPACEFKHDTKILTPDVVVYQEIEKKLVRLPWENEVNIARYFSASHFVIQEMPFQVPSIRPDPEKPNPKLGVGTVLFSQDNCFMATKNDNMPNVIWIWNLKKLKLDSMLVLSRSVRALEWDPIEIRLAACSGTNKIYMWSPSGCLSTEVKVEEEFLVTNFTWHQYGSSLLLMSKDHMCICYLGSPDGR